jgi:thioredoxin 1
MPTFNQKMLILLGVVVLGVLVVFMISNIEKSSKQLQIQTQTQSTTINWSTDLNSALKTAQKSNKLVFVDFYANWCEYCQELDEKTYPDQGVQQILSQKYVPVKVNVDNNPDLASKYNVYGLPTLVILDANGNEIKRVEGYQTPSELRSML